ncbi:preprotein translocase, SecG subunit [Thermodesulfatator indicus DSM 15286]|uniref:Protein-export membrane protein SecG n=1 Tax=Thermodesulfatator indicus (strain DSM 15286 / JCM 11887 / CIR29812) TaxID=667014 RepID=F8A9P5_THEID|nr:preprotein translocase subunit SecG [Thermodesulfatator indicus]AEH45279.1 preprotein translocase, SecG subunit [Thermodesulfatator indicus DSM 15286]
MFTVLVVVHIIVCIFLVGVVLVNVSKGSEVGAVFTGSQAIFGGAGPGTFLNKVTTVLAILFFCTSLSLTYISTKRTTTIMEKVPQINIPAPESAPTPKLPENSNKIPVPQNHSTSK